MPLGGGVPPSHQSQSHRAHRTHTTTHPSAQHPPARPPFSWHPTTPVLVNTPASLHARPTPPSTLVHTGQVVALRPSHVQSRHAVLAATAQLACTYLLHCLVRRVHLSKGPKPGTRSKAFSSLLASLKPHLGRALSTQQNINNNQTAVCPPQSYTLQVTHTSHQPPPPPSLHHCVLFPGSSTHLPYPSTFLGTLCKHGEGDKGVRRSRHTHL